MVNKKSIKNLKPHITTKEQAVKLGRKGGKQTSLRKKLSKRTLCNASCPIWIQCWAKPVSQKHYDEEFASAEGKEAKKKVRQKCALKQYNARTLERTEQILTKGEAGFEQEIMTTLLALGDDLDIESTPAKKAGFLYQLRECKKSIFGDKKRIVADVKTSGLVAADFADSYDDIEDDEVQSNNNIDESRIKK